MYDQDGLKKLITMDLNTVTNQEMTKKPNQEELTGLNIL